MDTFTQIITVLLSLKVTAGLIVNLTPTPKDDKIYAKFYKFLEVIAGIVTRKAKDDKRKT